MQDANSWATRTQREVQQRPMTLWPSGAGPSIDQSTIATGPDHNVEIDAMGTVQESVIEGGKNHNRSLWAASSNGSLASLHTFRDEAGWYRRESWTAISGEGPQSISRPGENRESFASWGQQSVDGVPGSMAIIHLLSPNDPEGPESDIHGTVWGVQLPRSRDSSSHYSQEDGR